MSRDDAANSPVVSLRGVYVEFPLQANAAKGVRQLKSQPEAPDGGAINSESGAPFQKGKRKSKFNAVALSDITLDLKSGDRIGLMGHNGAGKSTLIRVISGLLEPSRGELLVRGRVASTISTTFGFDMQLTGRENIIRRGLMMRMSMDQVRERLEDIIAFAELGSYIDMPMGTYSSGMRARLGFAVTTSVDADVLVMDEWLGAGDARFIEKCEERIYELIDRSRILVLASHNHKLLERTCNRFAVLDKGRIEDYGDFDQMKETGAVKTSSGEKLEALRKRLSKLKRENRQLKKQIAAIKPDDPSKESSFDMLQAENKRLKDELKNRRDRVQQLKAKIDDTSDV